MFNYFGTDNAWKRRVLSTLADAAALAVAGPPRDASDPELSSRG
jgi:hypothetical protein